MRKYLLVTLFASFFCSSTKAQVGVGFPIDFLQDTKGQNVAGYFNSALNQIIVDAQRNDSITHYLFDSSFKLLREYSVFATDRSLRYSKIKQYFEQSISLQSGIFEVYASRDSISLFKLDFQTGTDTRTAYIILKQLHSDETLEAVMPRNDGCDFLTFSNKNKKVVIYKWRLAVGAITAYEVDLPKSTLSKEEIKARGGRELEIKYKTMFSNLSINKTAKPAIFQFPASSQLFYNDSCIYILNKSAFEAGINVFKINTINYTASTTNHFVNKVVSGMTSDMLAHPIATIYDTLLIMQNSSSKKLEYYFFNLITGRQISRYETSPADSLYKLVHSTLRQIGTFASANDERQVTNGKTFIKALIRVEPFIKPLISKDSIILTFGAFAETPGMEGMLLNIASGGFASVVGIGASIGNTRFIPYLTTGRFIFLYAHSKFSLKTLQPSVANNITTYLDQIVDDKKLKAMQSNNSVLIELPEKLYIGIYNKKSMQFDIDQYQQQ